MGVIASIHIRHRQAIVEEAEMEFAGLQYAADVTVEIRRPAVGARLRMAPGTGEIGAVLRLQKANQNHLAHGLYPPRSLHRREDNSKLDCKDERAADVA